MLECRLENNLGVQQVFQQQGQESRNQKENINSDLEPWLYVKSEGTKEVRNC